MDILRSKGTGKQIDTRRCARVRTTKTVRSESNTMQLVTCARALHFHPPGPPPQQLQHQDHA
eukprot:9122478-Prorocentrum_lima.AAC.1